MKNESFLFRNTLVVQCTDDELISHEGKQYVECAYLVRDKWKTITFAHRPSHTDVCIDYLDLKNAIQENVTRNFVKSRFPVNELKEAINLNQQLQGL